MGVGTSRSPVRRVATIVRGVVLGAVVGLLSGVGSATLLHSLDWATRTRVAHSWLLWLLPTGGALIGLGFHRFGGRAARGTNLVLDAVHAVDDPEDPTSKFGYGPVVPAAMAPMVLAGTTASHLVGGSAGREGAAIQIAASLADTFLRLVGHRDPDERPMLLRAAIAGGFGSVFGTPVAGAIFGLEMPTAGEQRYDAMAPAFAASIVGDQVTRHLGIHHRLPTPLAAFAITPALMIRVTVAAIAFGVIARGFVELTDRIRGFGRRMGPEIRLAVGGAIVLGGTLLVGTRSYNGLSLPLIDTALKGGHVVAVAWLVKLILTSVTVGSGFPGGEVTPLFCVGATLGNVLAGPLGGSAPLLAALGYVSVFGAAANTPIAFTVLGAELFGSNALVLFAVANVVAYLVSGRRSVYSNQRRA